MANGGWSKKRIYEYPDQTTFQWWFVAGPHKLAEIRKNSREAIYRVYLVRNNKYLIEISAKYKTLSGAKGEAEDSLALATDDYIKKYS